MASDYTSGFGDNSDSGLFPALLLVAIVVLFLVNLMPVRRTRQMAERSGVQIESDHDLIRSGAVLGDDVPVFDYISGQLPTGTPISVPYDQAHAERLQRFWFALLPAYPISSNATHVILPLESVPRNANVLVQGGSMALIRTPTGTPSP